MKRKLIIFILVEIILITLLVLTNPFLTLKLNGDKTIKVNVNSTYQELNATSSFLGKDLTAKIEIKGNVDTSKIGEYSLEYIINYGVFSKKITRKVLVVDLNPPEIFLNEDLESTMCEYKEAGYKAIDDIDGDITDKVKVTKEKDKIIYTIADSSGNTKTIIRDILYDNEKPIIKLKNSNILTFELNSKYVEFGATATDNCDGDLTAKIEIVGTVDTTKHENFTVTYKVKDTTGNENKVERKVIIYNFDDLNKGYNEIVTGPTTINGILIVNKKYSIPSTYSAYNKKATEMVNKLRNDAKKQGIILPMKSGNRTYKEQHDLYERYKSKYGIEFADKRAARAGHSEHETGLAFDIGHVTEQFGSTKEGIWLKENCSKYGFIIRYPKYKEGITGYGYEPWHVRYVGTNIAKEIMEKEITLEEYLNVYKFE